MTDPRAGQPAQPGDLVDVASLVTAYYTREPDPADPGQQVAFGTSGHRGSAFDAAFNEAHILATTQAICEYRAAQGYDGPVLWIAGANSTYVLPQDRERMDALFPSTRLVRVKNAGHWVHSEQPEIFTETLRRFLSTIEG